MGWSLGLGIDGDMGKVQVEEGGLDLKEAIVKTVSKGAAEFPQEVVVVTILPWPNKANF